MKMKVDGTINKYKIRLVVKGYRQQESMGYLYTYSLMSIIIPIQILIVIGAINKLEIHMNVKTILLNGDLNGKIYIE
jgi:hypothetical protein